MANLGALANRLGRGAVWAVGLGVTASMIDACLYTGE